MSSYQFQSHLARSIRRLPLLPRAIDRVADARAHLLVRNFREYLPPGSTLIDIGCGTGHIGRFLSDCGIHVVGVDQVDMRMTDLSFIQADATALPFFDDSFDFSLLCLVLHHIRGDYHQRVLREAARVARKAVIVVEDVFDGTFDLFTTHVFDRIVNLNFEKARHSNRRTSEWANLLADTGLEPEVLAEYRQRYFPFSVKHAILMGHLITNTSAT